MLEMDAHVVRVAGETAWVRVEAPSSCGACGGRGCGRSLFARVFHAGPPEHAVFCNLPVLAGDAVVLGIPEGSLLRAAVRAYLLPLGLVIAGAVALSRWGDGMAAVGALAGLGIGFAFLRRGPARAGAVVLRRGHASACGSVGNAKETE